MALAQGAAVHAQWTGWSMATMVWTVLVAALGLAPGAGLDVLVLPPSPLHASLAGAAAAVEPTLQHHVRALRGVEVQGVRQQHVALDVTPQTAMACLAPECAAEMARLAGTHEAVWPVLRLVGKNAQLVLWRVDQQARVVGRVERRVALDRAGALAALVPGMVVELFPDFRAGPLVLPPAPPPTSPAVDCGKEDTTSTPEGPKEHRVIPLPELGFLLPAATGAGLATTLLVVLGALPTLLATAGLWLGTVYLLNLLMGTLQRPMRDRVEDRVMLQGLAVTTLLWPVLTAAPLVLLAPLVTTAVAVLASRIPTWLWARRSAPWWLTAVTVAVPVLTTTLLALVPLGAGLAATGLYVAPWVLQQHPKLQKRRDDVISVAILGVGGAAALAYAGAGITALLVVGVSLVTVPVVTAWSLAWDRRGLREGEETLPIDTLVQDAGKPSWRQR
jgi:hypothetical protein